MIKTAILTSAFVAVTMSCPVWAGAESESFDVLGSVMDKTKKEINAKTILKGNKAEAERFREKIIKGWWEFMQGNSKAKSGEYCMATFLQAKRDSQAGRVDAFKDGTVVMLSGPGGSYRGALLGFMPLDDANDYPKAKSGQPVMMTLKQGNEAPVTLNAIYMTVGKTSRPMIAFAVPNIQALMAGMEDNWSFEVIYQGKTIASANWHSGLKAREELKLCLEGKPFDNKSHLKDHIK